MKLVPESKNEHDKNAIAVFIAGELVGYISRNENLHVHDILKHHKVKYISSFIGGGQYKVVAGNKTILRFEESINITVRIGYVN